MVEPITEKKAVALSKIYGIPLRPKCDVILLEDIYNVFINIRDHDLKLLFAILYLTSVRISEALKIKRRDMSMEEVDGQEIYYINFLNLKNKMVPFKRVYIIPKTEMERDMLAYIISSLPKYHTDQYMFKQYDRRKVTSLFYHYTIRVRSVSWKRLCKICDQPLIRQNDKMFMCLQHGVFEKRKIKYFPEEKVIDKKLNPHYLRHCRLTHLSQLGLDVTDLMNVAGWASPSMATVYVQRDERRTAKHLLKL